MSPEWLQATATGFLMLLASYWIVALLRRVWRELLWREGGAVLEQMSSALGGPIRASRAGWEIRGPAGSLWVRGGMSGVRTRLTRADGTRHAQDGWPDPDVALGWLNAPAGDLPAPPAQG